MMQLCHCQITSSYRMLLWESAGVGIVWHGRAAALGGIHHWLFPFPTPRCSVMPKHIYLGVNYIHFTPA